MPETAQDLTSFRKELRQHLVETPTRPDIVASPNIPEGQMPTSTGYDEHSERGRELITKYSGLLASLPLSENRTSWRRYKRQQKKQLVEKVGKFTKCSNVVDGHRWMPQSEAL